MTATVEREHTDSPLNPVEVEQSIRRLANAIAGSVRAVTRAEEEARAAKRELDRAYARAYLSAGEPTGTARTGRPAHERKYLAELATVAERDACDVAEIAFEHAKRLARADEAQLRAWQSVGASVRTSYGSATGWGS